MRRAPTSAYLPNLKMRRIDDEVPSDMSSDTSSKAVLYKPPAGGKPNYLDFSPDVALVLVRVAAPRGAARALPVRLSRTPDAPPPQAAACGLHQLPKYERMKDKGLRGVAGMDSVLTYVEASDETIWPTERIKDGVISFTDGRLAGSVMKMAHPGGGQPVIVIVFGSPVDEGSGSAVTDALRLRHAGRHPSVKGAVIEHVAQQWRQMDQGLLDMVTKLREGPEKFGSAAAAAQQQQQQPHQAPPARSPVPPPPPRSPCCPPPHPPRRLSAAAQPHLRRGAWAGRVARRDGGGDPQD